jgi:hypothetical protein
MWHLLAYIGLAVAAAAGVDQISTTLGAMLSPAREMLAEREPSHLIDRPHDAGSAPMLHSIVAVRPAESGPDVRYARPDELLKIVVDAMRTVVDIDPRRSSRELLLHTMRDVDGSNELFA